MNNMKTTIQITAIGLDFDPSDKDDLPVVHYDLIRNGKKTGSNMKEISRIEAEHFVDLLKPTQNEIEKELNS